MGEIELDRSRPPEDADHDLELLLIRLDLLHGAGEVCECADGDPHLVAFLELTPWLGLDGALDDALAQVIDLGWLNLLRSLIADESGNLGRVFDDVPSVLAHLHFDEEVARKACLRLDAGLTVLGALRYRLGRDHDLTEVILHFELADPLPESTFDLLLEARVGRDDVPLLFGHLRRYPRAHGA